MISQILYIHLQAAEEKQNDFCLYIFTNKVTLWSGSCSACAVKVVDIYLQLGEQLLIILFACSTQSLRYFSKTKDRRIKLSQCQTPVWSEALFEMGIATTHQ